MSTEANKEIVRRWNEEFFNQRKLDAIDRFFHPNYVQYPGNIRLAAVSEGFTVGLESNPDAHLQIEDLIAEGDTVAGRVSYRATHKGEFIHPVVGRIPPTGKQITITGIAVVRISDGKIAEQWVVRDSLGMLQQLGVITAPAPTTGQ